MGFQINPYDMCVANKHINRKQCTIDWYLDDNNVSHVEQELIDDVINNVEEIFPGLTITKGNTHTFLVMTTRYLNKKKEEINMNR